MNTSWSARTRVAMACITSLSLPMSTSSSTQMTNLRKGSAAKAAMAAFLASPSIMESIWM